MSRSHLLAETLKRPAPAPTTLQMAMTFIGALYAARHAQVLLVRPSLDNNRLAWRDTERTHRRPRQEHGIVGNGWYFRDQAEVRFWLQPNALIQGEKVWQTLQREIPGLRCSQLFWCEVHFVSPIE